MNSLARNEDTIHLPDIFKERYILNLNVDVPFSSADVISLTSPLLELEFIYCCSLEIGCRWEYLHKHRQASRAATKTKRQGASACVGENQLFQEFLCLGTKVHNPIILTGPSGFVGLLDQFGPFPYPLAIFSTGCSKLGDYIK